MSRLSKPGAHFGSLLSVRNTHDMALQVGAVRKLTAGDNVIWETLRHWSEEDHTFTYEMQGPSEKQPKELNPFPTFPHNYSATFTLRPITEGSEGTFIEYTSSFAAESGLASATEGAISNLMRAGFAELQKQLS